MSLESDDSVSNDQTGGAMPLRSSSAERSDSDPWRTRRATSIYVVDPCELTQLGWYHTLYHVDDLLLVGTGATPQDAIDAVCGGWADLVLIAADADPAAGLWIEQELLQRAVNARYLFTSTRAPSGSAHPGSVVAGADYLPTRGGVDELVANLRSSVDSMFDNTQTQLQEQGLMIGPFPDPGHLQNKARGSKS